MGLPGTLINGFQESSKVIERQYLPTSCLQAISFLELNPLHVKLSFNKHECSYEPGTLAIGAQVKSSRKREILVENKAQSVNKLDNFLKRL